MFACPLIYVIFNLKRFRISELFYYLKFQLLIYVKIIQILLHLKYIIDRIVLLFSNSVNKLLRIFKS